jgi:hypothetical protein
MCAGDKDGDSIKALIEEGVNVKDDIFKAVVRKAPHRVCQVWGHGVASTEHA